MCESMRMYTNIIRIINITNKKSSSKIHGCKIKIVVVEK